MVVRFKEDNLDGWGVLPTWAGVEVTRVWFATGYYFPYWEAES